MPAPYKTYNEATYPVIIIGAGFGGIIMACQLKRKLGLQSHQFLILERHSEAGGTWWINKYPGVACDIPTSWYSISFCQKSDWSTFYPAGKEIFEYANSVIDKYDFRSSISLSTEVVRCEWDEKAAEWVVTIRYLKPGCGDLTNAQRQARVESDGEEAVFGTQKKLRCKVLVSAVGGLVEPKAFPPDVPGKNKFKGTIVHSARWNDEVDVRGKDVVVVGTGCSSTQLVPRLLEDEYGARSVTQLMREPHWVIPQPPPPGGHAFWERWGPFLYGYVPGLRAAMRLLVATVSETDWAMFSATEAGAAARARVEKRLIAHIKSTTPEKYHAMLIPTHALGCKRRIFDAKWFPAMHDDRFTLTTLALTEVGEDSVTLRPGEKTHECERKSAERRTHADVIVLANGFSVLKWFQPLDFIGRERKSMHDVFRERGGPQVYRGTALDGFPNLFILYGPNSYTGHSSVITGLENQTLHAIKLMRPLLHGDAKVVEITTEATMQYNRDAQKTLNKKIWTTGGCSSWYVDPKGKNFVVYPYSTVWQNIIYRFPYWSHWNIQWTRKGLLKRGLRWVARTVFMVLFGLFVREWIRNPRALKAALMRRLGLAAR